MTTLKNRWSTQFWVVWAWFPQFWVIAQISGFTQIWGYQTVSLKFEWWIDFIQIWVRHSNLSSSLKFEGKAQLNFSLKFEWRIQIWMTNSDLREIKNHLLSPKHSQRNICGCSVIRIIGEHIQVATHYLCFFTINAWQFRNCKEGFRHCKLETPSTSWVMFMSSFVSIVTVGYHKAFADYQTFKL